MKKALLIVAPKNYQDFEYAATRAALEEWGVAVSVASVARGKVFGKLGGEAEAQIALSEVKAEDYDAIVFIGGGGAVAYQKDQNALRIAREAKEKSKILAAICIAPTILAEAGALKNMKATVWNGDGEQEKFLQDRGAKFTQEDVVSDGLLITANGPEAASAFGEAIARKILN